MATGYTVRVKGLKDLERALRKVQDDLRKELQHELQEIARIVSDDARSRLAARYGGAAASKIRPRVKGSSAFAESRARSKGIHPNFGRLVMERGLLPARAAKQDEVIKGLEQMLDRIGRGSGF